jgi:hypothetical protein
MKDPERRIMDEKRKYIFEDTSFEKRTRVNWITDCLLGDIRTYLKGIKKIIYENRDGTSEKLLGGGNLSVPILISSALEFVSELYAGNTSYMLHFSTEPSEDFKDEWKKFRKANQAKEFKLDAFTNKLKEIIKNNGFNISDNAVIGSISKNEIRIDKYLIKKEGEKIKCYELYNATDNVLKFIEGFFDKEYRVIPRLLWDGMRNGLIHTFYPKTFTHQVSGQKSIEYIEFEFAVQTHRETLWYKRDKDKIRLFINIFELFDVFEKAVFSYIDELKTKEELQRKFIKAWSSIENHSEEVNKQQKSEVGVIIGYLDRKGGDEEK